MSARVLTQSADCFSSDLFSSTAISLKKSEKKKPLFDTGTKSLENALKSAPMQKTTLSEEQKKTKVKLSSYIALILVVIFFTGAGKYLGEYGAWFDYAVLTGKYGITADALSFLGKGGVGVRHGFIYGVSLIPAIMLALGAVEIATHFGALDAAKVLLDKILRPLMGIPGVCGLAMITSLQSSDAGSAMTRDLSDRKLITENEKSIFCAFQYSSGASVIIYLTIASVLFPFLSINYLAPLGIVLIVKVIGANLMRLYIHNKEKES